MSEELITKLEESSLHILDDCLHEIRNAAGGVIQRASDDELRGSLYLLMLHVIEFLRKASGATAHRKTDIKSVFLEGGKIIVDAIDAESSFTVGHSIAVCRHAGLLASRLGLSDATVGEIEYAARIHNIGLINSTWRAISVSRPLDEIELQQARNHCVVGAEMLRPIEFLSNIVPMVRYHHTRYDGSGFPGEIKGELLPLGARIILIADAYQAMVSPRPHRSALSRNDALVEIDKGSGRQFDPKLVPIAHELV